MTGGQKMLKFLVDNLEGLSEEVAALYEKVGDKFQLKVDGMVSKSAVDEFRNNNIALLKERDTLTNKLKNYGDYTPEQIAEMQAKIQDIDDKKLIDAEKFDELLESRTERMKADFEGQTTALETRATAAEELATGLTSKLTSLIIDTGIQNAATEVGTVRKGAMADVLSRGRRVFSLDENQKPIPKDADGNTIYGIDGKSPMTMQEWAKSQLVEAHFLFEGTTGGGAGGGDGHTGPTITLEAAQDKAIAGGGSADFVSQLADGVVKVSE